MQIFNEHNPLLSGRFASAIIKSNLFDLAMCSASQQSLVWIELQQ